MKKVQLCVSCVFSCWFLFLVIGCSEESPGIDNQGNSDGDSDGDAHSDGDSDGDDDDGNDNDGDDNDGDDNDGDDNDNEDNDDNDGNDDATVEGEAEFVVDVSTSSEIGTVGIVEWSINSVDIDRAVVEFGPDNGYGYEAEVDLSEPDYRTLLLGLKPSSVYHLRIVAQDGNTRYESDDYTVETGPRVTGLPNIDVNTERSNETNGGFTIACTFAMGGGGFGGGGGGGTWLYILDEDGEYVWWYQPKQGGADCVRARMSYDGKHMFAANGNVPSSGNGSLIRVTMDGLEEKSYNVPNRHHDIAVTPDSKVLYVEYDGTGGGGFGNEGCDRVMALDPETDSTAEVYVVAEDFSSLANQNGCHSNAINYVPDLDAVSLSILNFDTLILFDISGDLLWTLGGPESDYAGASWNAQHQHHVLDDSVLLFNNNGNNGGSSALEYSLNGSTADLIFEYSSGLSTQSMGDAKRLPNGNTLVTYSNSGVVHEVNADGELVEETLWNGVGIGYTVRRKSLYGPPPEYL